VNNLLKLLIFFSLFQHPLNALESDQLHIDGYINLDLQTTTPNFVSTGGIQLQYNITEALSTTAQLNVDTDDITGAYVIDPKWLYLSYELGYDTKARLGKFQFPIFKASEIGKIGYALTTTETPLKFYGAGGYNSFVGAELLQTYLIDQHVLDLQLSYGMADDSLPPGPNGNYLKLNTNSLLGLTLKYSIEWFWFNIGYIRADSNTVNVDGSDGTESDPSTINFNMLALESGMMFGQATLQGGLIGSLATDLLSDETRYYLQGEYEFAPFTPYLYYAYEDINNRFLPDNNNPSMSTHTSSLGIRYDLLDNTALKLSYAHLYRIQGEDNSSTSDTFKAVINVLF
jgi:hypothetical protein